jgi:hypothetical protein
MSQRSLFFTHGLDQVIDFVVKRGMLQPKAA